MQWCHGDNELHHSIFPLPFSASLFHFYLSFDDDIFLFLFLIFIFLCLESRRRQRVASYDISFSFILRWCRTRCMTMDDLEWTNKNEKKKNLKRKNAWAKIMATIIIFVRPEENFDWCLPVVHYHDGVTTLFLAHNGNSCFFFFAFSLRALAWDAAASLVWHEIILSLFFSLRIFRPFFSPLKRRSFAFIKCFR